MKKISILGGGNGGIFTALAFATHTPRATFEIELIHDPNIKAEKVGQGTVLPVMELLKESYGIVNLDWYNSLVEGGNIFATPKSGILYEGWAKIKDKFFHNFPADRMSLHFCPSALQKHVLETGGGLKKFKVVEDNIPEPGDVDADYVIDCRGTPDDFTDYDELINPINSVILGKPNWDTMMHEGNHCLWTRHVATPDGWAFVIPANPNSPSFGGSVGYLYNSTITSKEKAEKNMLEQFDVDITTHSSFKSYCAKNPSDGRVYLNGNRLSFIEPLESTAIQDYCNSNRYYYGQIVQGILNTTEVNESTRMNIQQTQNFILLHYKYGSQYDTPFWKYAQRLAINELKKDKRIEFIQNECARLSNSDNPAERVKKAGDCPYGSWTLYAFHLLYENLHTEIKPTLLERLWPFNKN